MTTGLTGVAAGSMAIAASKERIADKEKWGLPDAHPHHRRAYGRRDQPDGQ